MPTMRAQAEPITEDDALLASVLRKLLEGGSWNVTMYDRNGEAGLSVDSNASVDRAELLAMERAQNRIRS